MVADNTKNPRRCQRCSKFTIYRGVDRNLTSGIWCEGCYKMAVIREGNKSIQNWNQLRYRRHPSQDDTNLRQITKDQCRERVRPLTISPAQRRAMGARKNWWDAFYRMTPDEQADFKAHDEFLRWRTQQTARDKDAIDAFTRRITRPNWLRNLDRQEKNWRDSQGLQLENLRAKDTPIQDFVEAEHILNVPLSTLERSFLQLIVDGHSREDAAQLLAIPLDTVCKAITRSLAVRLVTSLS